MKKRLSVLAAVLACSLLFGGCSSPGQTKQITSSSGTANSNFSATGFPIVKNKVTLKVWGPQSVGNDYKNNTNTKTYEKKTGVHIDWDLYSASQTGAEAYNLMLASGNLPDIIASSISTDQVMTGIQANALLPLDSYIDKYGVGYKHVLAEKPEWKKLVTAPDGHIYTFVYTDTGVHKDSEYKMWVNSDWLKRYGKGMPTNTEEFKDMLLAFKNTDMNGNGKHDEMGMMGFYNGRKNDPICFLMNPFQLYTDNYYHITDDGKLEFEADTDGWRKGLSYIHDLYKNGLIAPETYVQDQTQFKAILNKSDANAETIGTFPSWYNGSEIDNTVMAWTTYEVVPPIKGPTGLRQTAARKGGNFNLNTAISTNCKYPDVAYRWLDWFLTDEGGIFDMWGSEGINFKTVKEKSISGLSTSRETIKTDDKNVITWNAGTFPHYDKASIRYDVPDDPAQYNIDNTHVLYTAAKAYEPYYVYHNIPDVVWVKDPSIENSISDYRNSFSTYIASTDTAFIIGKKDISSDKDWNEYLDTLKKMGLADYLEDLKTMYGLQK